MSRNDMIVNNEENLHHHSENSLIKIEIYKNLRRQSPSLTFILTIILPILLFIIHMTCSPRHTISNSSKQIYDILTFDFDCLAIVLGWLFYQSIFFLFIKFDSKSNLITSHLHRIIAFISSLMTIYLLNKWKILRASYVYDNIEKILFVSIIISYFIGILLFIKGTRTRHGKQINPIIGFFYGTDINLTISNINLRSFLEFRASLIGWTCFNLCFLLKTMEFHPYQRSSVLILVVIEQILQAFQIISYENNHFKNKTIGFLHVFNSLCCFPFLCCLPSQYLTLIHSPIKRLYIILSIIVFIIGMFIYRRVNKKENLLNQSDKNNFKLILINEKFFSLKWFLCRYSNYLGNLFMFLAWSLLSGSILISWIVPIYYIFILYHKNHAEELIYH